MASPEHTLVLDPRKERALANRKRMIKAAYTMFCERGYSVPLTAIATEAGVAVQTLYFTFHNKAKLLQEAQDYAVLGDDDTPPDQSAWFRAIERETDMRRVIGFIVGGVRQIIERVSPLVPVLQAASNDPEVSAFVADREQLRVEGYRQLVAGIARKGGFKPRLSEAEATDILLVLTSAQVFRLMTKERGWTSEEWESRTTRLISDALLRPPGP